MPAAFFVPAAIFVLAANLPLAAIFVLSSKISVCSYFWPLMLRLHFVPGSLECHHSQKRSSQWGFRSFLSSPSSSVSCYVLSLSDKVSLTEARRRAMVCHGWLYVSSQPATFWWDLSRLATFRPSSAIPIKFQVLSRFSTVKCGPCVIFQQVCAHGIKRGPQNCCNL